jgi:hypothetical protein
VPVSRLPLLVLAVAAAAAAGCGGGSAAKDTPRLTESEFVQKANNVCIRSDRRVFKIGRLGPDPEPWGRTADAAGAAIREMRRLRPPAAEQRRFDALMAAGERVRRAISDVHDSLVAKKYDRARSAQVRALRADSNIKVIAHGLGLTFCEQLLTNWPA